MIGSPIDHLGPLNQCPISFVELKKLSSLLSSTDINLAIHRALQNGAKITKRMLHLLEIDGLASKVLKVMHNYLFSIWYKNSDSIVF
jgi:hypothetical protein